MSEPLLHIVNKKKKKTIVHLTMSYSSNIEDISLTEPVQRRELTISWSYQMKTGFYKCITMSVRHM